MCRHTRITKERVVRAWDRGWSKEALARIMLYYMLYYRLGYLGCRYACSAY